MIKKKTPQSKGSSKFRQESKAVKPSDRLRRDDEPPSGEDDTGASDIKDTAPTSGQPGSPAKHSFGGVEVSPKSSAKHNFNGVENSPKPTKGKKTAKAARRVNKSKSRVEKSGRKLDAAREKLAKQKPEKRPGVGNALKQAAGFEIWAKVHGKIHEVEHDNVGVEAAHRVELFGETAGRAASHYTKKRIRNRPARRVRKWEKKNFKAKADLRFRQLVQENPALNSNPFNRFFKKRRLRKLYQKQAKEAAKKVAQKTGEKTVSVVGKAGRAVVNFIKRNPAVAVMALMCFLLVFILHSCVGMMATVGGGVGGSVGASTYPSEDSEILAAEAAYAGIEANLQYELDNYASLQPGYDEYHLNFDAIEHDPYVLISILSAMHDGEWRLADVQGTLNMLFYRQYTLTQTVVVEVRSYTYSWTDATGASHTETVYYDYYICTATLKNFNMSHLPVYIMDEEKLSRYALFMETLGNRPDLFPGHLYPNASIYLKYERYGIPPEYLDDETFAAMIKEAEKHLGRPYVWGGSNPSTSFDCSGFVSWVINHSGWSVGRLSAQGLYDICTPVSPANAMPGDLIFFKGTYDTPNVSHVGIYVGDGMMIHCGNPISYASTNTSYWQRHFFNFGRLN
jgi:hypothetical protein